MESARERYARRLRETTAVSEQVASRQRFMTAVRTILFFVAAAGLIAGYSGSEPRTLLLLVGWASALGFLIAITVHEYFRIADVEAKRSNELYRRLKARTERDWESIPGLHGEFPGSALADDLDLFGSASLWQLLNLGGTPDGRRTLFQWLITPPTGDEIRRRQEAVKELRDTPAQRERLVEIISSFSDESDSVSSLAAWASGPRWLPAHRVVHVLSYIGPSLFLAGCIVLVMATAGQVRREGALSAPVMTGIGSIAGAFALNLLITVTSGSWLHEIFVRINGRYKQSSRVAEAFDELGGLTGNSELIRSIRSRAAEGDHSAVNGFRRLRLWIWCANLQRDPLFYIIYLMLQLTVLWDFRILERLEAWQSQFGSSSRGWFEALGDCEALISGATLAEEYPDWCFPGPLTSQNTRFVAEAMGHPLLKDTQRVTNNVHLESERPLLLVTGSNMAGKSTLLRAWGLNELLHRIGAPVCAKSYQSPIFELATSIRVRDSLKEGVSFFMAELKRLKEVVDIAEQGGRNRVDKQGDVLFLLDEILQGTNSRERQIAVVRVVQQLVDFGACGAISTHDLELADQPDLLRISQIVHFREYFEQVNGEERMRFDYQMRPGPTPTSNALKLLALVGLGER